MRSGVLHRWSVVWSLTALLYGGAPAFASEGPAGVTSAPALRPDAPVAVPLQAVPTTPHLALLLPGETSAYATAAEAVKQGFLAAAQVQSSGALPIRIYAITDESASVIANYRSALVSGARIVVGPLTRGEVSELAASRYIGVPTLALNVPERGVLLPRDLYVLSLHVEAEARQVARLAAKEGRANAFAVVGDTPLLRRMHLAFVEEFTQLGGKMVAEVPFTADAAGLAHIRESAALGLADMAFLALDFSRARLVRPYLGALALYATSQVNPGHAGPLAAFDLANVRFLDMPWLLQPDHPAVMIYPRRDFRDAIDLERLYALGIDAFRIAQALLQGQAARTLDGVTGRLSLRHDHEFARELVGAQFADGKLLIFADKQ